MLDHRLAAALALAGLAQLAPRFGLDVASLAATLAILTLAAGLSWRHRHPLAVAVLFATAINAQNALGERPAQRPQQSSSTSWRPIRSARDVSVGRPCWGWAWSFSD